MTRHTLLAVFAVVVLTLGLIPVAAAQSATAFTYQGRLEQDGAPYTGTADVRFQLLKYFDTPTGTPVTRSNVNVVNGVFTVSLDFGFDPTSYELFQLGGPAIPIPSLEISVRTPAGSASPFQTLTPPQSLASTPLAQAIVGLARISTTALAQSNFLENAIFQINADVSQTVTLPAPIDLASVVLQMVNTGPAPAPVTLTILIGNTIITTSTATVPLGSSDVTFSFPLNTNIGTVEQMRIALSTTTNIGVRYSTANPYAGGQTNFLTSADLAFSVNERKGGQFFASLPFRISAGDTEALSVISDSNTGTRLTLLNAALGSGAPWLIQATGPASAEGAGKLRLTNSTVSESGITIDSLGRVGIGENTPLAALHIGGVAGTDGIRFPDGTTQVSAALQRLKVSLLIDFGPIPAGTQSTSLNGVANVAVGDVIVVSPRTVLPTGLLTYAVVSGPGAITVVMANTGTFTVNPVMTVFDVVVLK
jgi:hypothetical protein